MLNSAVWFAVKSTSGWQVSVIDPPEFPDMDMMAERSLGGRVIAVMVAADGVSSMACEWSDGRASWSISHDPIPDGQELVIDGEAPAVYDALKGAGIFDDGRQLDVAVEVAYAITGYRQDAAPVAPQKRPRQMRLVEAA